jgi:hypothetical protein
MPPNRFTVKMYYMINLTIHIGYHKYYYYFIYSTRFKNLLIL